MVEDITILFIVPTHLYLLQAYSSHRNLPSRGKLLLLKLTTVSKIDKIEDFTKYYIFVGNNFVRDFYLSQIATSCQRTLRGSA